MKPNVDLCRLSEDTMVNVKRTDLGTSLGRRVVALGIAAALVVSLGGSSSFAAARSQESFSSPEQAVQALVAAARSDETADLLKVFGQSAKKLVVSGDPVADKNGREKFVAAYDDMNRIDKQGDDKAVLVVGKDEWSLPIPIVMQGNVWRFDTKAGEQEIIDRRVGKNELSAVEVCRAYVDAQREYASEDRNGDGILEYAQTFASSAGKHDGLYWKVNEGEAASPMGPLVVSARSEGYTKPKPGERAPYHGYLYKILKKQGKHAPGGAHDYVIKGRMIGGFALVAFPAQYGASGIMTFVVNQDGVVYEKNLGPNTEKIASGMTTFNPDTTWKTP